MIITMLPDNKRLHLQHGPIDLIVEAFGVPSEIDKAYRAAGQRFATILEELVAELPKLRQRTNSYPQLQGPIARAMHAATMPHCRDFITPMAAVAGAVADEVLSVVQDAANLSKAYVNNGGDIALWLNSGESENFNIGIVSDPRSGELVTTATITSETKIAGIATSGRHGRSHSLGVADSVTVFAKSAAVADAAATIIANHVNLPECLQIQRQPANQLSPDSDLGAQLVTVSVARLTGQQIADALSTGREKAEGLWADGVIEAAFLSLQGQVEIVDWLIDERARFAPHSILQTAQIEVAHA